MPSTEVATLILPIGLMTQRNGHGFLVAAASRKTLVDGKTSDFIQYHCYGNMVLYSMHDAKALAAQS